MLNRLFKKEGNVKNGIWEKLQKAEAGALIGSKIILSFAILYENPREIALPEKSQLAQILISQYRGPDLIPENLSINPGTLISARKLVYGKEINKTSGLDTAGSNKILAEMLISDVDAGKLAEVKAMAFSGDSPALGQTFFALLTK